MDRSSLVAKINTSYEAGDYEEALQVLDQLAVFDGDPDRNIEFRFDLLVKAGRFEDARLAGLKMEQISTRKSPWNCLKVAEASLGLGQVEEALAWVEKAVVERHFKRYDVFDSSSYDLVRENPGFIRLMETTRQNIGLDLPLEDFNLDLLDGSQCSLSALKGQVVLLDFWATTCPPCRREMPSIKGLYHEFKDRGFEIIGISLDTDIGAAENFVLKNTLDWKICCTGKGFSDDLAERFHIESIPSTWLIDPQGILRCYNLKGQDLRDAVSGLLAGQGTDFECQGNVCRF